jgi:1-deoxyxylulose-5-phosphate synthase
MTMQYQTLGHTGFNVSRLCLGMMTWGSTQWRPWIKSEAEGRAVVKRAVELGINFFDTADMYSAGESERITGRLVQEFMPRHEAVIATKVFFPVDLEYKGGGATPPTTRDTQGLSRARIMKCIDDSLKRLGTEYVDLYQIHRYDPLTPIAETMQALHDVVKAGKARAIGASSMWAWQFAEMQQVAQANGWTKFATMQNHYNLAYREEEREMIPYCVHSGVALMPWSPLARGFLAGTREKLDAQRKDSSRAGTDDIAQKYYYRNADFAVVDAVTKVAKARGVSNAEVAYAWLLHQGGVTSPIVGCSRVEQLEQAVKALEIKLNADELQALAAPYTPHMVLGHV